MEKFGKDVFEEFEEHGEEYQELLNEETEFLREEIEDLDEIIEKEYQEYEERFEQAKEENSPFWPEPIGGEERLKELYEDKYELEEQERNIDEKLVQAEMVENIETKIRPKSEYWAERYTSDFEKINEDAHNEIEEIRKCEEQGTEYIEPYPSAFLRRQFLDTKIKLASDGVTPDGLSELTGDWDGLLESGHEHFETKKDLSELLEKVSYEQANEILENEREKGKYSDNNYYALKAMLRKHHTK